MKTRKSKSITLIISLFAVIAMISWDNGSLVQGEQKNAEVFSAVAVVPEGWRSLFDGETLTGWKNLRYGGNSEAYVSDGVLVLPMATNTTMSGVCWIGDSLPVNNYEVYYEARRVAGNDIFAGLTFPYDDMYVSLIFGGWQGSINGLSSIEGFDASDNETTQFFSLRNNQWYPIHLRVTTDSIRASIGTMQVVDFATEGKYLHLRSEVLDTGFTLWTFLSAGEIRDLRIKKLQSYY